MLPVLSRCCFFWISSGSIRWDHSYDRVLVEKTYVSSKTFWNVHPVLLPNFPMAEYDLDSWFYKFTVAFPRQSFFWELQLMVNWWFGLVVGLLGIPRQPTIPFIWGSQESKPPTQTNNVPLAENSRTAKKQTHTVTDYCESFTVLVFRGNEKKNSKNTIKHVVHATLLEAQKFMPDFLACSPRKWDLPRSFFWSEILQHFSPKTNILNALEKEKHLPVTNFWVPAVNFQGRKKNIEWNTSRNYISRITANKNELETFTIGYITRKLRWQAGKLPNF